MNLTPELVAAIGTAIVTPIVTYLKSQADAQKRGEKRNEQISLIEQRLQQCEKKSSTIDELKTAIAGINVSLAKIETLLEILLKDRDEK